ncbi:MAG: baeRF10 domain-containing protein [Planctomycetota bacterium]|jgi:peptide chain release factor subunit 1
MLKDVNLRELAEATAPDRAFLSLYLSNAAAFESLQKRIRKTKSLLKDNRDEREYFDENMKLVEKHLKKNPIESGGLCIFACWALDFFKAVPLDVPVPDLLIVDSSPYIRPLAELQDEYENFAVVTADNKSASIYMVISAKAESEKRVTGNIKNHVRKGGWSQQRYERRRDKQLHNYAKDIADRLAELDRTESFRRILMAGSKETLNEIRRVLPAHLVKKLVGEKTMNLSEGGQVVNREIFDLYFDEERRSEEKLWERIRNEYLRKGKAAVGAADVLRAVKAGRVSKVVVTRGAGMDGARCRECDYLGAGTPAACPECASDSVYKVDLINEIVELLATTGAEADFVDPIPGLSEVGDIAALLRY